MHRPSRIALLAVAAAVALPTLSMGADRGLIRGEVLRARNRPLVGAVALAVRSETPAVLALTTTDEFGFFRLKGLPNGTYWTAVLRQGYAPFLSENVAIRGPFPAILDHVGVAAEGPWGAPAILPGEATGGSLIDVRVVDENGKPVPETRVHLLGLDAVADPVTGRTGSDGRATVEVPAGRYRLRLFCVGKLPVNVPEVSFPGGDVSVRVLILEQPLNYRPDPTEILPEEWAIMPPGAVVNTTLADVLEAELIAEGEAVAAALAEGTDVDGDGTVDGEPPAEVPEALPAVPPEPAGTPEEDAASDDSANG